MPIQIRKETEKDFDKIALNSDGSIHMGGSRITELKQFIADIEQKAEQRGVEKERERIKKHIYDMRKETTPQRNETISEVLYSIENDYLKTLSSKDI